MKTATVLPKFTCRYEVKTVVDAPVLWKRFVDVATWKDWNAGVASVELEGPFVNGNWFTMAIPGGPEIRSQLIDVHEPFRFTDRTILDGTCVEVCHRIDPLPKGGCIVSFETCADGPAAKECGQGASADFPQVLAALVALVEKGTR
jgi:hypothetical protein